MEDLDITRVKPIEILLAEDNPGDARLTVEGFKDAKVKNNITVVEDGMEALAYLRHEGPYANAALPDLILLDLNMPKKDGREVLAEIKADEELRRIPVLVFTISNAEKDILEAYDLQASAFITKPIDLDEFITVVRSLEEFWLTIVKLPQDVSGKIYA
ncbi:MAG: response regulator [Chloroflexi bacterium]|nr:response regulator [Chloroflexota bacterium]MCH8350860.1 response regulator [Chloroflexota bacterium]MCI0893480.1 response regulator [Chloroflexota bacterium]